MSLFCAFPFELVLEESCLQRAIILNRVVRITSSSQEENTRSNQCQPQQCKRRVGANQNNAGYKQSDPERTITRLNFSCFEDFGLGATVPE